MTNVTFVRESGAIITNMESLVSPGFESNLVLAREHLFNKLEKIFDGKTIEAHVFGSIARGTTDAYSDIDIWFTFRDEEFKEVYEKRFEYYALLGDIIHICEPPQNAPVGGVYSAIFVRTGDGCITVIDVYLCPLSTAFIIEDGKKLSGLDLPKKEKGEIGFNPQKVQVDENYRIDFFICFVFYTLKKLARHKKAPLEDLLRQYDNLSKNFNIQIDPVDTKEQDFDTLEKVIENMKKVSNKKQKETLNVISGFAKKIFL